MYPVIYSFDSASAESYYIKLSNGESVINRQLRLLRQAGIFKVGIAGDKELYAYCMEQTKKCADVAKTEFQYLGSSIDFRKYEDILLLKWNMVYTQDVIAGLIQTEEKVAVASCFRLPADYKGIAVRIDMDHVIEIAKGITGLDCCPVYPAVKLSLKKFQEEEKKLLEENICYGSEEEFFEHILECISKLQKGILYFCEPETVLIGDRGSSVCELPSVLVQNDEAQRKVFSEAGASVAAKKIVQDGHYEKPLVVYDDRLEHTSIKPVFEALQFKTEYLPVEEADSQKLQQYDLIIAIGRSQTLQTADDARGESEEQYPSTALLMIPLELEYTIGNRFDYLILDASSVAEADDNVSTEAVYGMVYDAVGEILYHFDEEQLDYADRALTALQGTSNKLLKYDEQALQKALEARRWYNKFKKHNELQKTAEICASQMKTSLNTVKAVSIPYVFEKLFSYLEIKENEEEIDRKKELLRRAGRSTGLLFNDKFSERMQGYSQKIVDVGIYSGMEAGQWNEKNLEKSIRSVITQSDCELLSTEDIVDIAKKASRYSNRGMITSEEKKRLEKESMEESGIKPAQPLKKRIKKRLKRFKLVKNLILLKKKLLYKAYQVRYPVNTKWIVFESYGGTNNFGCNTRAIYEAMLEDPDYFDFKFIWAFNKPAKFSWLKENQNTVIVKRGSRRYIRFCARARYIFTNTGMPKYIKPNKNQEMVYTWHGKPLKKIGCSFKGESEGKRTKKELIKDYTGSGKRLSKLLSPAPIFTDIMADAYNLSPEKRKSAMVETGYPRNDFLFKYTLEDVLKIKMKLHIPLDKKVILYAPTWRPFKWIGGKSFEHTAVLDLEKLKKDLGNDYVFLCRLHHLERDSMHFEQFPGFVYDVSMVEDVNELYIISDMLISDYSGTVFDFANLCRPILLFMYDKEEYVNDANGLNFDLDFLPGPIVEDQDSLTSEIKYQMEHFVYDEKYRRFNEACNGLDGADCSSRTAHQIVEVNPEETKKQKRIVKFKIFGRNTKLTLRGYLQKLPFIKNENTKRIESYRNKYKGQRCFLIGNGPSLRLADLNMLKDEICFGCNMIYKVFERSDWRPTFLCASDRVVAQAASEQLQENPDSTLWVSRTAYDLMQYKGDNLIYVSNLRKEKYYVHGDMTEYYVPSIATVMTFMIELAMYMGFSEIYLLGVDFTIGHGKNDHFMNSYRDKNMTNLELKKMRNMFKGEDIGVHQAQIRMEGRALYAYEQLERYAKKHGYHVYNATRGGMLEVFERADLDKVVKDDKKSDNL